MTVHNIMCRYHVYAFTDRRRVTKPSTVYFISSPEQKGFKTQAQHRPTLSIQTNISFFFLQMICILVFSMVYTLVSVVGPARDILHD